MYKYSNLAKPRRSKFSIYLRTSIGLFFCALLLIGIIPPPLITYMAPAPLAEAAASLLEPNVALAQSCAGGTDDLGGLVWDDDNTDGIRSGATEIGVDGTTGPMTVEAHDRNGLVTTVSVGADGTYLFDDLFAGRTGDDAKFRLEFIGLPPDYAYSLHGDDNGTATQFHNTGTCDADLGIHIPTGTCDAAANALVQTYGMVMTCGADDTTDVVMALKDAPDLSYNSATQTPNEFTHADWTLEKIGNIYFIEFDDVGNIYGAASAFTQQDSFTPDAKKQYGTIGGATASGTVYKFDAVTGAPTVFATLPQEGGGNNDSGLGGITYDISTNSMYVVNMFDNTIYQLNGTTGVISTTYQPDPATLGVFTGTTSSQDIINGFQAVPFGVDIYDGRLYYTVHDATDGGSLVVRSVALDGSGGMTAATDQEEINQVIPNAISASVAFDDFINPALLADPVVADIDFSPSGQMAVGTFSSGPTAAGELIDVFADGTTERSYYAEGHTNSMYNHAGLNYTFEPDGAGGWTQTAITSVGQESHPNVNTNGSSTGGIAWNLDPTNAETLWMSGGDFKDEDGNWGIVGYNSTQLDNTPDQEDATDYIQFLFGPQSSVDPKGNGGDVDVFYCGTPPLEIGSRFWVDSDDDGIHDPDEPTLPNIDMVITDPNGITTTVTTGPNGEYFFPVEPNVQYEILIDTTQPGLAGVALTTPSINSNIKLFRITTGNMGESNHMHNFGFTPNVSIGSTLFYDYNDNGFQDTNEPGISGIQVQLQSPSGQLRGIDITDTNGDYLFDGLFSDDYKIVIPIPPADAPTSSTPTDSGDNQEDGDDNGDQPGGPGTIVSSPVISLTIDGEPVGETEQGGTQDDGDDNNGDMTIDFGFVPYVSVGSTLFYDPNNNGLQETGEGGIPGIMVELRDITGTVLITTTTDTNGDYLFEQLLVGDYQVAIPTPPANAPNSSTPTSTADDNVDSNDDGSQPDGAGGEVLSPVINLFLNDELEGELGQGGDQDAADDDNGNMTIDFGFVPAVSIGSTLFYDPDDSGTQDAGEAGIPTIVVELRNISGTVLMTDTTDGNGDYFFGDLLPGDYQVVIPAPPTDAPTSSTPTDSADNQEDGDDNGDQPGGSGGVVSSPVITLGVDEEPTDSGAETAQGNAQDAADDDNGDMTIDFGFIPYVSLGSTLFYDNDNSGTQDTGELGIPNMLVELRNITGTVVATTTTDTNGDYFFGDLLAGDYQVVVPTPPADAPTSSTPTSTTDDNVDGDDNGAQPNPGDPATSPIITLSPNDELANELGQGGTQDAADDDNGNMTVDFGFVPYVSIGSTLFYDPNDSGSQDTGEMGIPSILVELRAVDGTLLKTTTTDSNGDYYFGDLLPGSYQVVIPTPPADAPTSSTPTDSVDNQEDGDDNGDQPSGSGGPVQSPVIMLAVNGEPTDSTETAQGNTQDSADDDNGDMTVDFGFVPYVSLGSTLFYDDNNNGFQDNGEPGIPGITIALQDGSGNPIATTATDGNGNYLFQALLAGNYQVVVPTPPVDAPTSSTPTSTADDNVDSDNNGAQLNPGDPATSPVVTLSVDGEPTGELGQGGTQDAADDDNGNMTVDFGFVRHVSIGSTLFYDPNDNGFQDSGEAGISGIIVELHDTNGNIIATMTTDANGDYYFGGLLAGNYQVVIPTPPADAPTSSTSTDAADNQEDGDDNGDQPAGSGGVVTSPVITLTPNQEPTNAGTEGAQGNSQDSADDDNGDMTIDFGFIPYVSLGSTLFYDNDNSGTQDSGESGIPNTIVTLYDANGNLIATTTTDGNGDYYFGNLLPGDYQVVVPTPPADAPTSSTPTSTTDDDVDGDDNGAQPGPGAPATSPIVTLSPNGELLNEPNQGGNQDAADDDNGNMTVDFGFVPYVSIGSTLFYDHDDNGTQDGGEAGIPNIVVELHDTAGNIVATTTTDGNGDYYFGNLLPGDYQVVIPTPPADAPTSSTPTDMADNQEDGDDNGDQPAGAGGTVTSPVITLAVNSEPTDGGTETAQGNAQDGADDDNGDMTVDFGFIPYVLLGSTLFYDDNDNGMQDAGEAAIPNIVVTLHDTSGNMVATTTTDQNGDYLFDGLLPGGYQVVIPTPPADAPTSSTPTDNADNQEDGDDNGHQPSGAGSVVTSPVITLVPNGEPVGELGQGGTQDATDDDNGDMTIDFGFVRHVSIGSTLFYDDNDNGFQDAGDPGIPGLVVELHDTAGNILASTTTDANGDYYFGGLLAGDYQVVVPTPPADAPTSSTPTDMADNQEDGDDNGHQPAGTGGVVTSPVITLVPNGEPVNESGQGGTQDATDDDNGDMTIDFGFVRHVSIGSTLFYDDNNNGFQDSDDPGIPGLMVELHDTVGNILASTTTDANGDYYFGGLLSGDYQVVVPTPPADAPTSSTPTDVADNQEDGDDNGDQPDGPGGASISPVINLAVDGEPTDAGTEIEQGNGQDGSDDDNGDMTVDFGFIRYVSLGSTLFYDPDDNGIQDVGEPGIPGIVVELRDPAGNVIATTMTDQDGNYFFGQLLEGDYQIVLPEPPLDAPISSTPVNLLDDDVDGDNNGDQPDGPGGSVSSPIITLIVDGEPIGEPSQGGDQDAADDDNGNMTVDFGFIPLVSIGSTVFYDPNDNGIQDADEPGIPGVVLEVHDTQGNVLGQTITDGDGNYFFGELTPGDYRVVIPTPPADAPISSTPTNGADDSTDNDDNGDQPDGSGGAVTSPIITLGLDQELSGETAQGGDQDDIDDNNGDMTIDFGFIPLVSVGSTVFYDPNDNGIQDPGEPGIPAVGLELHDTQGNILAQTTTDGDGNYFFGGLIPGDYQVVIPVPPTDAPISSTPTNGTDDSTDNDDNGDQPDGSGGTVSSPIVTLGLDQELSGETGQGGDQDDFDDNNGDMTIDFGFIPLVSIGSTVFYDPNDNGIQDPGEPGIHAVGLELHDTQGNVLAQTTTDGDGNYFFGGLMPGDYQVMIPVPPTDAPISSTPTNGADDSTDSDDNGEQPDGSGGAVTSPIITLGLDQELSGETGQGGDQDDFDDNNGDMTIDFGFIPLVSVGSSVFYDPNDNGIQDIGEPGIPGVVLEIHDTQGNVLGQTTTDEDGSYFFSVLTPGDYQIVIPAPPVDAPASSTPTNGADDSTDSDDNGEQPDGSGGIVSSPILTLSLNEELSDETGPGGNQDDFDDDNGDMTIDFGFVPLVSIGSTVFYDPNDNGFQDPGETGIPGVVLEIHDMQDNILAQTTTDEDGNYFFSILTPGDYQVVIPAPPVDAPLSSTLTNGTDDGIDNDDNGEQPDGLGGAVLSPVVTLTLNGEQSDETGQGGDQDDFDDDNGDMTIDFGFVPLVSIGSTVFYDPNDNGIQDPGEVGIPNVLVELYDTVGNLIATNRTDGNGDYYFGDLLSGDYQVVIETPPADAPDSSTPTDTADNQEDGDDNGDQPGGSGAPVQSPMITLTVDGEPTDETEQGGDQDAGDDNNGDMTIDFGFVPTKDFVSLGSTVFYDLDDSGTQDPDEAGIPDIMVELWDSNGTLVATDITDVNGDYYFAGLEPGDYQVTIPNPPADAPDSSTPTDAADNQEDGDDNGDQPGGTGTRVTSPIITLTAGDELIGESAQGGDQDDGSDSNGDMTIDFGFVPNDEITDDTTDDNTTDDTTDNITDEDGDTTDDETDNTTDETTDETDNNTTDDTTDEDGDTTDDEADNTTDDEADNTIDEDGDTTDDTADNTADDTTDETDNNTTDDTNDDEADNTTDDIANETDNDTPIDSVPTGSIGSTLFYDFDNNGIQDDGEAGISDIIVVLHDAAGNRVASTTTDENGDYYFGELPPGDYQVVVPTPPMDAPTSSTPTDMADNQEDGDDNGDQPDGSGGAVFSPIITLTVDGEPSGETAQGGNQDAADDDNGDMTVDFGFIMPATVGDRVWYDNDQDGIQDDDELGVENVTVNIFNNDGKPALDINGEPVPVQITDAQGNYLFTNLPPDAYYVIFDLTTLPEGYIVTQQNGGNNDGADSDGDATTGHTHATDFLPGGHEDLTLDLGIYDRLAMGSITSLIWMDTNGNGLLDEDEEGIPNITVFLNQDDKVIDQTTTDEDGRYNFDRLTPDEYYVTFAAPDATIPTVDVDNIGPDLVRSPDIMIVDGDYSVSILDIGFTQFVTLGDYVWFDTDQDGVADENETGVPGVVVLLLDRDGNQVDATATDSNGFYEFRIPAGEYQLEFIPPAGMTLTKSDQGDSSTNSDADEETKRTDVMIFSVNTSDPMLDAGLVVVPTAIRLTSFTAKENQSGVTVRWSVRPDAMTFGFEVYRSSDGTFENAVAVTDSMILTSGTDEVYTFTDTSVHEGELYTYWLVETASDQQTTNYGPVGVVVEGWQMIFLPLVYR